MLTDNRSDAIKALETCHDRIQAIFEQAKRDLDVIDRSIQLLREGSEEVPIDATHNITGYSELRPQEAVERFFREHPGQPYKPSKIAKRIIASGYRPTLSDPNVFVTQVRTSCLRLTDKGVLVQTEIDGKTAFRLIEEGKPQ